MDTDTANAFLPAVARPWSGFYNPLLLLFFLKEVKVDFFVLSATKPS